MSVELHYDGAIFELDPAQSDEYWIDYIEKERTRARFVPEGMTTSIDLADGRRAHIWLRSTTPIALVAPREAFDEP